MVFLKASVVSLAVVKDEADDEPDCRQKNNWCQHVFLPDKPAQQQNNDRQGEKRVVNCFHALYPFLKGWLCVFLLICRPAR